MDGAEVAQLLADRLYVDKFAKMTTKFIEQIREENCEAEEDPEAEEDLEVEEDLAVEEEREEVPSALRRFLHKREVALYLLIALIMTSVFLRMVKKFLPIS